MLGRERGIQQVLQKSGDHRQRCPQFVGGIGHEVAADQIEVKDLGDIAADDEPLAPALAEGRDAHREREGAVVLRCQLDGPQALVSDQELPEWSVMEELRQVTALVSRPMNVHQLGGHRIRPLDTLVPVEDDQGVRHRDRRLAKAADETDLALAAFTPALLMLGHGAVDHPPETVGEGWSHPMAAVDEQGQAAQIEEIAPEVGQDRQEYRQGQVEAQPGQKQGRGQGDQEQQDLK